MTLVCEEDTEVEAHRVILSACSPFFSTVLKKTKHPHPMIYMKGLKSKELINIMDFIYHGEVSIYQEDLDGFLVLAEELQLKGLTGSSDDKIEEHTIKKLDNKLLSKPKKIKVTKQESSPYSLEQGATFLGAQIENNTDTLNYRNQSIVSAESTAISVNVDQTKEDFNSQLESMMENINEGNPKQWRCTVCGRTASNKNDVRRHVESHIEGVSHACSLCGKVSRSSKGLVDHMSVYHKK